MDLLRKILWLNIMDLLGKILYFLVLNLELLDIGLFYYFYCFMWLGLIEKL